MNTIHGGALLNITDTSTINLGTINPFRYRSYYYDTETQLYYLNSRYYNPQVGRFINADSGVTGQGITGNNMFAYCGNNFVNKFDNLGTSWKWLDKVTSSVRNFGKSLGRKATVEYVKRKNSFKNTMKNIGKLFGVKNSSSTGGINSERKIGDNGFGVSYGSTSNSSLNNNLSSGAAGNIIVNTNTSSGSIEAGYEIGISKNTLTLSDSSIEFYSGTILSGITVGISFDKFPSLDLGIVGNSEWALDENGTLTAGATSYAKIHVRGDYVAGMLAFLYAPGLVPYILFS